LYDSDASLRVGAHADAPEAAVSSFGNETVPSSIGVKLMQPSEVIDLLSLSSSDDDDSDNLDETEEQVAKEADDQEATPPDPDQFRTQLFARKSCPAQPIDIGLNNPTSDSNAHRMEKPQEQEPAQSDAEPLKQQHASTCGKTLPSKRKICTNSDACAQLGVNLESSPPNVIGPHLPPCVQQSSLSQRCSPNSKLLAQTNNLEFAKILSVTASLLRCHQCKNSGPSGTTEDSQPHFIWCNATLKDGKSYGCGRCFHRTCMPIQQIEPVEGALCLPCTNHHNSELQQHNDMKRRKTLETVAATEKPKLSSSVQCLVNLVPAFQIVSSPPTLTETTMWEETASHSFGAAAIAQKLRVALHNRHPAWSDAEVQSVVHCNIGAYRFFLQLMKKTKDYYAARLLPSAAVTEVWQIHTTIPSYNQEIRLLFHDETDFVFIRHRLHASIRPQQAMTMACRTTEVATTIMNTNPDESYMTEEVLKALFAFEHFGLMTNPN
jgi:hypothetical protein